MNKKLISQVLIYSTLFILVFSTLAYVFLGSPHQLKPPKNQDIEIKPVPIVGKIVNKTDEYIVDFKTREKLNLSSFNVSKVEYIPNEYDYDATLYINIENISDLISYLHKKSAFVDNIRRKVTIEVDYLNSTNKATTFYPTKYLKNNTIDLVCRVEFVDKVPTQILDCLPKDEAKY